MSSTESRNLQQQSSAPRSQKKSSNMKPRQVRTPANKLSLFYFIFLRGFMAAAPQEVSPDSFAVLFLPGGSPLKFGAPFPELVCARRCVTSCPSPIGSGPRRFQRERDGACVGRLASLKDTEHARRTSTGQKEQKQGVASPRTFCEAEAEVCGLYNVMQSFKSTFATHVDQILHKIWVRSALWPAFTSGLAPERICRNHVGQI